MEMPKTGSVYSWKASWVRQRQEATERRWRLRRLLFGAE
jgi:hypothetical protein